jgi:hypothetical protein
MGVVYRAIDTRLGRQVAIRIGLAEFFDRFHREARTVARLNVPTPERADVLVLDEALGRLEELDPRKSRIVEMRFFGGLSLEETTRPVIDRSRRSP